VIGGVCSTQARDDMHTEFLSETVKGIIHLEDLDVDRKMKL